MKAKKEDPGVEYARRMVQQGHFRPFNTLETYTEAVIDYYTKKPRRNRDRGNERK